jgi:hypothetical protein
MMTMRECLFRVSSAYALVLTLAIANHRIHRILIDTRSSAYILFKTAFELMKIDR